MRTRAALLAGLFFLLACSSAVAPPEPIEYRIEFVYATASDGVSRFDVLQDSIVRSIRMLDDRLYELTGRRLRTDGSVREVVLPQTEVFLAGNYVNQRAQDFLDPPDGTLVHVYYDGPHYFACGHAAWPPVVRGQVSAIYLRAKGYGWSCVFPFLSWRTVEPVYPMGYREWSTMHELFHLMGMVPPGVPGSFQGHTSDTNDVMCCTAGLVRRKSAFLQIGDSYRETLLGAPWLE